MKNKGFFNVLICAALSLPLVFAQVSCDDDDDDMIDTQYTLSGNASGTQEVPSNPSTGTGSLTGSYNSANNTLSYTITWTGLSGNLTAAHFHGPALPGASAGPIHDLVITSNGTSGTASATLVIHDTTESHLLAGKLYYNLHTALYTGGEIRGQVNAND
jgi:hypothetical protein